MRQVLGQMLSRLFPQEAQKRTSTSRPSAPRNSAHASARTAPHFSKARQGMAPHAAPSLRTLSRKTLYMYGALSGAILAIAGVQLDEYLRRQDRNVLDFPANTNASQRELTERGLIPTQHQHPTSGRRGSEATWNGAPLDIPLTEISAGDGPRNPIPHGASNSGSKAWTESGAGEFNTGGAAFNGITTSVAALVSGQGQIEVPLRSESGGLWVDVRLNDRVTYKMLLDTGASVVIVPGELAEELGIPEQGVERELRTIQGSLKGKLVTLDRIGLGGAQATDVPAVVIQGGSHNVGLLGRSFLSRFAFGVDLDKGTLTLRPRQTSARLPLETQPSQLMAKTEQLRSPVAYISNQIQQLQEEKQRAALDPNTSTAYMTQLDSALEHWRGRSSQYR